MQTWPVRIAGYFAYFEPRLTASQHREDGLAMLRSGVDKVKYNQPDAEIALRGSIEHFVEAFLHNRVGNADLFALAHRVGALVEKAYGCYWTHADEKGEWINACPVLALHSRIGASWGGVTRGRCSICNADDFQCDHVPGVRYGGVLCFREVYRVDLEEVSLTPHPEDPSTYRVHYPKTDAEVEALRGRPLRPGERPVCMHCQDCPGRQGPQPEDLNPALWPELPSAP
jgi:hypothetical protein